MVSVSTKSKRMKLLLVLLVMVVSMLCMGCDLLAGRYPCDRGTEWVCSDPSFTLSYIYNPNGTLAEESLLEIDGELIAVEVYFYSIYFKVVPRSSEDHSHCLFSGTWKYRGGNLVLKIDEDIIFDHQYKEFVFSSVKAD